MLDDQIAEARREAAEGRQATKELELTDKLFSELRAHTLETIVLPGSAPFRDHLICVVQVIDDLRERLMKREVAGHNAKVLLEQMIGKTYGQ
jgi:hypothetical protein